MSTTYTSAGTYRLRITGDTASPWKDVGLQLSYLVTDLDPTTNYKFEVQWCLENDRCSVSATDVVAPSRHSKFRSRKGVKPKIEISCIH